MSISKVLTLEKFIKIGTIFKPSGTQGEVKIDIDENFIDDFLQSNHFFLKFNGSLVPYFIENLRETNHLLLKVEEIDEPESALHLNLKDIYLRRESISSPEFIGKQKKNNLMGYNIINNGIHLAQIEFIELMPQQTIAWISINGKRIAIPLADALITDIDHPSKNIIMTLPDGLLEL